VVVVLVQIVALVAVEQVVVVLEHLALL